jgi:hypothetical protein
MPYHPSVYIPSYMGRSKMQERNVKIKIKLGISIAPACSKSGQKKWGTRGEKKLGGGFIHIYSTPPFDRMLNNKTLD